MHHEWRVIISCVTVELANVRQHQLRTVSFEQATLANGRQHQLRTSHISHGVSTSVGRNQRLQMVGIIIQGFVLWERYIIQRQAISAQRHCW